MNHRPFVAAAVLVLTLAGYFWFPGHTYLEQDTQVYLPILEHLWDRGALANDLLATRPHLSFTIYDEVALGLRKLTGAGFEAILKAQQLLFRAAGILGVYLIVVSVGLSWRAGLLVAAAFSLGATVLGPAVLTIEYEPVPRGFAVPLLVFAAGLAAAGHVTAAAASASLAFLYHPPTTVPFWAVYAAVALRPSKPEEMWWRIRGLFVLAGAVTVMLALSRLQTGATEAQPLFALVDPAWEQVQRTRAPYNWVSLWVSRYAAHYLLLWAVSAAAAIRLWREMAEELRWFAVGMPLAGMLSVAVSYVLLEKLKWALIPQVQPARALVFVVFFALVMAGTAGARAVRLGRPIEALLWFLPVFAIPSNPVITDLVWPGLNDPLLARRAVTAGVLAAGAMLALRAESGRPVWAAAGVAAVAVGAFGLIPGYGKLVNCPAPQRAELEALAGWARSRSESGAVFLFPEAARQTHPGVFRATALRAVYVDWKSGGQVNFLRDFSREWWSRWKETMDRKSYDPNRDYSALGIDYVVLDRAVPGRAPVFENARYRVYRTRPGVPAEPAARQAPGGH